MGGANGSLVTLRNNVINFLQTNNTSGAAHYLSNGLTRVLYDENISGGTPNMGQISLNFPCIFVSIANQEQTIAHLGSRLSSSYRRNVSYELVIHAATQIAQAAGGSDAEKETYQLTDNIIGLLKSQPDMSMTGHWISDINVTLDEEVEETTYAKMSKITVTCNELA